MDGERAETRMRTSGGGVERGFDGEARLLVTGGVVAEEGSPVSGGGRGGAPCEVGGDASACDPEHDDSGRCRFASLVSGSPALRGIGCRVWLARSIPAKRRGEEETEREREK